MAEALAVSGEARRRSAPNPWVGCVVVTTDGTVAGRGATEPPGGRHAEVVALDEAREQARGSTAYVTLEPCVHLGRTGPCVDRLVEDGVARVVIGALDPDARVAGAGVAALEEKGVAVDIVGLSGKVEEVLAPYLVHRRSGRPLVVLKLAATLDGYIAAPDGSSRWITGPEAREDVHELRADSDAVLVGAGTVRADDPELTVRLGAGAEGRQPLRVVLGRASEQARVQPALELSGDLRGVLDELGRRGVLQLLVEGGAAVAGQFHRLGLVDRYVFYLAPAVLGGEGGTAMFSGPGAGALADAWRGHFAAVTRLGDDLRLDVQPLRRPGEAGSDHDARSSLLTGQ